VIFESRRFRLAIEIALAAFAPGLCWMAVDWALRPGLSMILDETSASWANQSPSCARSSTWTTVRNTS